MEDVLFNLRGAQNQQEHKMLCDKITEIAHNTNNNSLLTKTATLKFYGINDPEACAHITEILQPEIEKIQDSVYLNNGHFLDEISRLTSLFSSFASRHITECPAPLLPILNEPVFAENPALKFAFLVGQAVTRNDDANDRQQLTKPLSPQELVQAINECASPYQAVPMIIIAIRLNGAYPNEILAYCSQDNKNVMREFFDTSIIRMLQADNRIGGAEERRNQEQMNPQKNMIFETPPELTQAIKTIVAQDNITSPQDILDLLGDTNKTENVMRRLPDIQTVDVVHCLKHLESNPLTSQHSQQVRKLLQALLQTISGMPDQLTDTTLAQIRDLVRQKGVLIELANRLKDIPAHAQEKLQELISKSWLELYGGGGLHVAHQICLYIDAFQRAEKHTIQTLQKETLQILTANAQSDLFRRHLT